jgi:dolichol-phosphate mannosyltransferase
MKISIVIPTYNEKENIEKLASSIFGLGISGLGIIIVDDNSPDGTGELLEAFKKKNDNLHVIHRQKKLGLGTAYIEGFKCALKGGAEYIFEMDADFSHDFLLIPEFIKNMEDHDLVVGSRYVAGGKIVNWNLPRRIVSRFGNFYARNILNLPFRDLTTGYKCYRRSVLEKIINSEISAVGYAFQIETTYRAYQNGFRILEIPISFSERRLGKSKFDLKIIWESFGRVASLRFFKNR